MKLYHVTSKKSADMILREGFRDWTRFISGVEITGVWFSDRPWLHGGNVSVDELPDDKVAITLNVADHVLDEVEVEDLSGEQPYREWCIPAQAIRNLLLRVEGAS